MAIGKITSKSLAADAVTSANLAPGAVTISDIPDSEITADKLHTTLDLSTKTLTLTQASVTAHESALTVTQSQISDLSTTSDLAEGTNLYYTDARADARAQLKVDALVGAAPGTLDTLEELGDALGDDPNFATTVTNSIATKLPLSGGTMTGNVNFGDNDKAIFGAGGSSPQLQIYTDGSNSYIDDAGSGRLNIRGAGDLSIKNTNNETYIYCVAHGQVQLYHDDVTKLTTTSTGIDVTGTVTSDGLTVDGSTPSISNGTSPASFTIGASNGASSNLILKGAAGMEMQTYNGGWKKYFNLAYTGDISFYEDTGTTPKFFWDSSAKRLGIGTSSPAVALEVDGGTANSGIVRFHNNGARFLELSAESDGTYDDAISVFKKNSSVGQFSFRNSTTEYMRINASGNVGIGTTDPKSSLHVSGDIRSDQASGKIGFGSGGASNWYSYMQYANDGSQNVGLEFFTTTNAGVANINHLHLHPDNGTIFNEAQVDQDFRVASNNNTHALFVDGGADMVCFGTSNTTGLAVQNSQTGVQITSSGRIFCSNADHHDFNRTSNGDIIRFRRDTNIIGTISSTTSGTTYATTSDRRLKDNIEPIADATDKLMDMKPVTHTWIDNPDEPQVHGFIAQEMQEIVPEAVSGDAESDEMMSMDYGRITPVIVAALQDALKEIKELKTRIDELENK